MVGFSDPSDTDESAIDEIISQAQDACVLEQISAINCSGFTDSVLPTELESRFRKLKSFPVTKAKRSDVLPRSCDGKRDNNSTINSKALENSVKGEAESNSLSNERSPNFSPSRENPDEKMDSDGKVRSNSLDISREKVEFSPKKDNSRRKKDVKLESKYGSVSSASDSPNMSEESSLSSQFRPKLDEDQIKRSKVKSKSGTLSSPLSSSNWLRDFPSPPRKASCFWCSPKKDSKKKNKDWAMENVLGWDKNEEFLSDMGSFSSKHQQKMLKKAIKEEQKISREAEKIVQWAKQASARMTVSGVEDDLSDD